MKRKLSMIFVMIFMLGFMACATTQPTIQQTYTTAQKVYLNAWDAYHTAFLLQNDVVKAQWAKEYHPIFLKTAQALQLWSADLSSITLATNANQMIDQLTTILLQTKR